jgi:hypothetical protein
LAASEHQTGGRRAGSDDHRRRRDAGAGCTENAGAGRDAAGQQLDGHEYFVAAGRTAADARVKSDARRNAEVRLLAARRNPMALQGGWKLIMANDDVLARVKRALRIEDEPAFRPLVVRSPASSAVAPRLHDSGKVADLLERAKAAAVGRRPDTGSTGGRPVAEPQLAKRRVEIMVTGSVSRVGVVRTGLRELQTELFQQLGSNNLELRVTAFLDGCRHTTPWSRSPIDAGGSTTYWHCYQGQTRYAEAFSFTSGEDDPVDAIVMFGDRFDDNLADTLGFADALRQRGTRIYAFHVGRNSRGRDAYRQLAERTGGVFVQLSSHHAFTRVMPVIADYLVRPAEALRARPSPRDADVRALIDRLKVQAPPPVLRLTWRQP